MAKSPSGRKGKIVTEEDTAISEWLTEKPEHVHKVESPISNDPWLNISEDDGTALSCAVAQAIEEQTDVLTTSISQEMLQPSETELLDAQSNDDSVDMDSDEGQNIIISDTTFDDGLIMDSNDRVHYADPVAVSTATEPTTNNKTENVAEPPSDLFGELNQTLISDNTVLLTSTAPFRAYIWGAYQLRVLHGTVTVHGAQLTCAQTHFVPVYALRVKALPAIESVTVDENSEAATVNTSGNILSEQQLKEACGDKWDSVADQVEEVRQNNGWLLLVRRLQSRFVSLLATKHGDTFTPASSSAGDDLHRATGCVLMQDADHARKAGVALYRSCADRDQLQTELVSRTESVRVAFAGGKGVGKSTLLYRMVNALLSRHAHLYVLDCDPGQAEFTPCACLSLVRLQRFHIGPSFTHIQQPVRGIYTGEVSVANDPAGYLSAVRALSDTYWQWARNDPAAPLLINTMGWAQDLGAALLLEVLALVQPTDVVELTDPLRARLNFDAPLDAERVNVTPRGPLLQRFLPRGAPRRAAVAHKHHRITRPKIPAPQVTQDGAGPGPGLAPWMFRQLNTTAMVAAIEQPDRPLCQVVPYCIRWSSLAVRVRTESELLPQHMMHAINGCVVALCRTDPSRWLRPQDPGLFSLLPDHAPPPDCLGFGVVRGVDWDQRAIYLLTSLADAELRPVNTLMRGPHHVLDVFPKESGLPVPAWTPAITGKSGGPLDQPHAGKSNAPWKKPRRW